MRRPILLAAVFLSGVAGGCFLKPAPAPAFRYSCESTADCFARDCKGSNIPMADADGLVEGCDSPEVAADGTLGVGYRQVCIAGLCEYPCDLATFKTDCPASSGYLFCMNGKCANTCGTDAYDKYGLDSNDDFCTDPQKCIPFAEGGLDPTIIKALTGQGGINPDSLPDGAGICGTRCDAAGAPDCPPGQFCTGALCLPGCDNAEATPCADGTQCFAYGGLAACLTPCDDDDSCPEGLLCVPEVGICQPTCLGDDAITCDDGFDCSEEFGVCIPSDLGGSSSGSETTE